MHHITVKCQNTVVGMDWIHRFSVYPNVGPPELLEECDFEDEFNMDIDFDCFNAREFWIVYYFYENSVADLHVFQHYYAAAAKYTDMSQDHILDLYNEDDIHVVEKNKMGEMRSTIYHKDDDGAFIFPDKGSRYGLLSLAGQRDR